MRVGIDGIVLQGNDAGSLRYFEQLLASLAIVQSPNEYVVFAHEKVLRSPTIPRQENLIHCQVNGAQFLPGTVRQQLFRAWDSFGDLDLLHAAAFIPPLWFKGKTIATIFDLTFIRYPQTQKWTGRFWWRMLGKPGVQKADHLTTISQSSKNDLRRFLNVPEKKISVVYPYVSDFFKPVSNSETIVSKYKLPENYILFVGTLERRKNLVSLLRAFALCKRKASIKHGLVLVGKRGWLYRDIFQAVEELGLKQDVFFLGYVPNEDLPGLYSAADLSILVSLYEGFGLPVLESMACGTPVITSNVSSLPEVAGDATILVPPTDIEQIASAMIDVLSSAEIREQMIARGFSQVSKFTRERFAKEMIAAYEKTLETCGTVEK
jgi:glycosyltransferase involved in cell wall biosynthesis